MYNIKTEYGEVIIIDHLTGYKKPGSRWENFQHEMVEIKEKLKVQSPQLSFCSITQCMFFNKYDKILGVTGTIGDETDEKILKNAYRVNLFKVPRDIAPRKPIYYRERPRNIADLYQMLYKEESLMTKLCVKFSPTEKNTIESTFGNYYEIIEKIDGNCYMLCDKGDKLYNECFKHSNNYLISNQKYQLVNPIRAIRLNETYLVEIKDEPGIWNRGRLDTSNNVELTCYSESLKDALESL